MKKEHNINKNKNNAQDGGNTVLLSTKDSPAIAEILQEVESDLNVVGDDPSSLATFLSSEFTSLGRSLLRCGYVVQQIDEQKLYKVFGFASTASLLEATFGLKAPVVSRFRTAYAYALPISKAVPEVTIDDLNEAQMRELNGAVKALHPDLKGKQKIGKAVEFYKEIHGKNSCPTSSDIAKFCKSKIAEKNKDDSDDTADTEASEKGDEDPVEHTTDETEPSIDSLDRIVSTEKEDLGEPLEPIHETRADDFIGTQLAEELAQLLGILLQHSLIQDEIKERLERAFEQLDIEPVFPDDETDTEEEHEDA